MTDAGIHTGDNAVTPAPSPRRKSRWKRWLLWSAIAAFLVFAALGITTYILLQRAEPLLRAAIIDQLQKEFHAKVELDTLHVVFEDGITVQGEGLRIWLPPDNQQALVATGAASAEDAAKPWIVVGQMHFHIHGRIRPNTPILISVVHVENLRVLLPPKAMRPKVGSSPDQDAQNAQQAATTESQAQSAADNNARTAEKQARPFFKIPEVRIRRIECNSAELVIERNQEPGKPPRLPLDFQLQKLTLLPDPKGGPTAFDVEMTNAKPIGLIHSTGHFGSWVSHDPGALPIDGNYSFSHADLSTIKGIAGILSSTGSYQGTLREIEARGHTITPDFRLERVSGGKGLLLTTDYQATIDGTNGDVYLHPVNAMLGHTHILAKGKIVRASDITPGVKGHDITLDVAIDRGRIEDVLNISTDSTAGANQDQPFLVGNLTLRTKFHLPPGQVTVIEKLQLKGQFHLDQVRFSSDKMQGRIADLSLRGQGKPGEVKQTDPESILSEMQGDFELGGGKLDLPDLSYNVPGAEIRAHGTYGMQEGSLNFEGDARLDATVSQAVGGWKGLLLKPADHFLKKNGAGTDVPIHVNGTRKDPKFGVDFDRLGKTQKPPATSQPQQN